ncbi:unnamed protein product [Trichobilharzia regenti]|nr:unnamed protein product [Trichobilharzia regenti]
MKPFVLGLLVVICIQCTLSYVHNKDDRVMKKLTGSNANVEQFLVDNKDILGNSRHKHRHHRRKGSRRRCKHGRCRNGHRNSYGSRISGPPAGQGYRGGSGGGMSPFGGQNIGALQQQGRGLGSMFGSSLGGMRSGGLGGILGQQGGGGGMGGMLGNPLGGILGQQGGGIGGMLGNPLGGILGQQGGGMGGMLGGIKGAAIGQMVSGLGSGGVLKGLLG